MRVTLRQWAYIRALAQDLGMDEDQAIKRACQSSNRADTMRGSDLIRWLYTQFRTELLTPVAGSRYRLHFAKLQDEAKAEAVQCAAEKGSRCGCGGALKGNLGPLGPFDECAECGRTLFGETQMARPNSALGDGI